MDAKELKKYIDNHRPLTTRYFDQKSYKIGENAAIHQLLPKPAPDNRIPTPFVRRATNIIKGYFAQVGNITYSDPAEWFENTIADIYDKNDEEVETASMFEDAICYGKAYELHWYDETDKFQFIVIPVSQSIPIYTEDLKKKLKAFIWYKTINDDEIATYYDDKKYIGFRKPKNGEWTEVKEESGIHLYGKVPVLEANIGRDGRNVFDHCLPLIDMYDKIISETGNEHEKFANSILLLRDYLDTVNKDENGLTAADKVNQWRVIDKLGDNVREAAAYLERNVNDTFIFDTLNRIERLIYEMLCIFNPNDDTFATASGIAQAYKLLGFEYMIADMESYFTKFLYNRIRLIAGHAVINQEALADDVTVSYKRNLPFDIESTATIVATLSGTVSKATLLKMFPSTIIPDIDAELEAIEKETPKVSSPFSGQEW
jgi:SPP1 family phage portal protein